MRRADVRAVASWVSVVLLSVLVPSAADAASARGVGAGHFHSCVLTTTGGVQCWGDNNYGQLGDGTTTTRATPEDVAGLAGGVVSLSVGYEHACAVTSDGAVRCWGYNLNGALGNGTTTNSSTPVGVTGLASGALAVVAGHYHTCALLASGGVKCWGRNNEGQLGDGTTVNKLTPVDVSGLSGVRLVHAAGWNTCAVIATGGAKCWGYNEYGSVGDGTTTNRSTPVDVSGLTSGVVGFAGGAWHNCALKEDGSATCWGENSTGQLGNGTTTNSSTPVAVTGLTAGVAALSSGPWHACAVLGTGALQCWGSNSSGQLGDGTPTSRTTPVGVSGLASGVALAAGGVGHTCALVTGGGVKCWGDNAYGQIGDGSGADQPTPVGVVGFAGGEAVVMAGVRQVAPGGGHTCALTNAGGVLCWGENAFGQLGDATMTARWTPVPVHGLANDVAALAIGRDHSCVLTSGGGVRCWGDNQFGQLGDATTTSRSTPVDVTGLTSGVSALSAGRYHTCALTTGGGVKCWGSNDQGQIGDNSVVDRATPTNVIGLAAGVAAVSAGGHHSCALTTGGGTKCWGSNDHGELGNGTTTDSHTSVWVSGLTSAVAVVSASLYGTCALTASGALKCWGYNLYGQVGDGTTTDRLLPTDVTGLASGVADVSTLYYHVCARTTDGRILCWGDNMYGQLGDGTTMSRATPAAVPGLASGVTSVVAGLRKTCIVTPRAGAQCWGSNESGQLGDGTTSNRSTPVWVTGLLAGAGMLAEGDSHTCRLTATGGVQCWGYGAYGQLGVGTFNSHRSPVDVSGLTSGVAAIGAGGQFTCALTTGGGVKCWGDNMYGQLGDGTTTGRQTPVDVVGLTSGAVAIAVGNSTVCATTAAGGLMCWGYNHFGQLGDGTTTNRRTPVHVIGLTTGVAAATAGKLHTCVIRAGDGAWCWGNNTRGQLGDGTTSARHTPTPVVGLASGVTSIVGGWEFTCAITAAGRVQCWGRNNHGQVGDGSTTDRSTPVAVSSLASRVGALSLGGLHTCAVTLSGGTWCWGYNYYGQLGDGSTTDRSTPVAVTGASSGAGSVWLGGNHSCVPTVTGPLTCWGDNGYGQLGDGTTADRSTPTVARGFKQDDDYDTDLKADVAVYRPASGTWFSLDSSTGNSSYQYRGWGVQAQGDTPVGACDFDGDGIVDPTVFRPSAGTWFILESSVSFTTWEYFGWGSSGDTPVAADYDGDGMTDAAVYRPSTGVWYVRPSSGATQWNVAFGNATDVPIPGHYDADGKADIAVYRPSTGTWFVLTSSSGFASYWYLGWGVNANGDTPAPGDYDGDGKLDLCVFRPSTGSWYVLESQSGFTTWRYVGWGGTGDTVVPADYDGDGLTDAAVYRPSTYTWYVRPSSGATQWSVIFGQAGDVPLITIR